MRVIAGKCRSLPLKTIPGSNTRPTTDRIKETLFNILQPNLPDCRFLDLFAGSGAIGIEALSRGASFCCFVEQNKAAVSCIRDNLKFTRLENQAVLLPMEVHAALSKLRGEEPFDCIFMDPPYRKNLEKEVLIEFTDASFIGENTLIVVEASLDTDFSWAEQAGYLILREKKYKTNVHVFLKRNTDS
ncbi:MAG: 16S rRNA (guanine(966)-N(2))-methyltransferase RsmD [Fusicatenibacter sp.]|nr:16S rRNA (guanine(966)-N(2))-methyltransferase RsmD [Lachnospiraceae bacterium]MDY2939212.1 16S rRNA (guanine(966)-N(2))-methyltransferase RsmD [Fusicatenibacter sp.]